MAKANTENHIVAFLDPYMAKGWHVHDSMSDPQQNGYHVATSNGVHIRHAVVNPECGELSSATDGKVLVVGWDAIHYVAGHKTWDEVTNPAPVATKDGWGTILVSKKSHYFVDGVSLCRKYGNLLGHMDEEQTTRLLPGPNDCKACHRKAWKLKRSGGRL